MTHPTEYDPLAEGLFADNAALIAGGLEPERPTVGECHPGLALFYAGRLNEIHGEPGTGKSNLAAVATLTVLAQGKKVVCIDPEDTAISAIRRLVAFGCTVDAVIEGYRHTGWQQGAAFERLLAWIERERPALVILDGLAEALAAEGLSEDAPDDFLKFCRERLTPIANLGAAVLIADHVVKNTETRGRWSRGTGAKMGRYDGVSYSVALGKGYSPTQAGFVRLRVAKDRNGGVGVVGQEMAEIHFTPAGNNRTSVQFKEPANKDQQRFVPTAIMEKVSRRLELFPDSSLRDLRALGKADYVDTAIAELASLGHLEIARGGPGKPTRHRLINPYREHEEDEN
jgi:hypothetical protein